MDRYNSFSDFSKICRFCLKQVNDEKVKISQILRQQFKTITNIELDLNNECNNSCKRCCYDIRKSSIIKTRLLKNQKRLEEMMQWDLFQDISSADKPNSELSKSELIFKQEAFTDGVAIKEELNDSSMNSQPTLNQFEQHDFPVNFQSQTNDFESADNIHREIPPLAQQSSTSNNDCNFKETEHFSDTETNETQTRKRKKYIDYFNRKQRVMCEDCGNYFTKSSLKNHRLRKHSKEVPKFECDLCDKSFFRKGELRDHMTIHTGLKELSCHLCGKKYGTRNALNMHINKFHLHKWQVYCEYCGKHFTNRGNYAGHIRSNHTGEKPFQCPECSKSFYNKGDLKKHRLHVHLGEEQTCEICQKVFQSIISLRRHKRIHVAVRERKFECSFENCDKKFLTNALLVQHQKVHVGQKDFRCALCGMEYFKNAELKRHIRSIHMKIKLKCEILGCKSQFARKETYRNHILSHHKDIGEINVKMMLEKIRDMQLPEPRLDFDQDEKYLLNVDCQVD